MTSDLFEIPESALKAYEGVEDVWSCSAEEYVKWSESFGRFALPKAEILFPWLHGVDGRCSSQNLFFRVRRSLVPLYRGMLLIHAHSEAKGERLVESFEASEIVHPDGRFVESTESEPTINLRNFKNQPVLMASLSDLFLFGDQAVETAIRCVQAQRRAYASRQAQIDQVARTAGPRAVANANRLKYKTIVIRDAFATFEQKYREYVMYDSQGHGLNLLDLTERENQEMKTMSKLCRVTEGVWVGHSQEVPLRTSIESNPHQIAICIECHELGDMPSPSELTLARETLNDLDGCKEMIHLDMYGIGLGQEEPSPLVENFMNLLQFMRDQVGRQRQILIHCSDGYTESSVLVLAWLMYYRKCRLPEAYLDLQHKRSFFVYSADLSILKRLEWAFLGQGEPEPKRRKSVPHDALENLKIGEVYHGRLSPTEQERQQFPWFYSPRFEGSFPSRILPFLYLGNLNHATNTAMLKAIGITHVVSVGENADLAGKGFQLLFLDNLYDDGIDAIRERLEDVVAFVEGARKQNQACLIHCRVGVSRSAAVTICYVMHHLHLGFLSAYLFVRARRLNVIIQPNLKFVYEMLQLEQKLTGVRTVSWPVLCQEIHKLNLAYRDNT
ncbi:hypothetical protein BY458DRAFT_473441 [Sporodiniella umbellata]|nr:hypothetical protein BY458DRAFT_473441 [Sporodiniella umbellata]